MPRASASSWSRSARSWFSEPHRDGGLARGRPGARAEGPPDGHPGAGPHPQHRAHGHQRRDRRRVPACPEGERRARLLHSLGVHEGWADRLHEGGLRQAAAPHAGDEERGALRAREGTGAGARRDDRPADAPGQQLAAGAERGGPRRLCASRRARRPEAQQAQARVHVSELRRGEGRDPKPDAARPAALRGRGGRVTAIEPLAAVQQAVFTKLRAHAGLLALVPATRILDAVPERETFPYIVYDAPISTPERTFGQDGREVSFVVTVFSREGSEKFPGTGTAGYSAVLAIADQIVEALVGSYPPADGFSPLSVSGFDIADFDVVSVQASRANDGISRQADCTFVLRLERQPEPEPTP
ncbi:MAG: hypothetical protein C0503_02910 [Gemmatimonas sp.]|nr:hypothetical protein [Gemmatimonas sp.]